MWLWDVPLRHLCCKECILSLLVNYLHSYYATLWISYENWACVHAPISYAFKIIHPIYAYHHPWFLYCSNFNCVDDSQWWVLYWRIGYIFVMHFSSESVLLPPCSASSFSYLRDYFITLGHCVVPDLAIVCSWMSYRHQEIFFLLLCYVMLQCSWISPKMLKIMFTIHVIVVSEWQTL